MAFFLGGSNSVFEYEQYHIQNLKCLKHIDNKVGTCPDLNAES